MSTYYAIFEKAERYHLADAIGSRVFRTLGGAQRFAREFLAQTCIVGMNADLVVILNSPGIATHRATIDRNNRIHLLESCPCTVGKTVDTCTYHGCY